MRILLVTTRDLCYFSADFFAEKMREALTRKGADVTLMSFPEYPDGGGFPDFSALEGCVGKKYDAVIDFNSKLPYMTDDSDGREVLFLDLIDAPFFNYILDHPLYHHPGLIFPVKRYFAIAIDRAHQRYMKEYYNTLSDVFYLPLAGTESENLSPANERKNSLLFTGTYVPENDTFSEMESRPECIKKVIFDISDFWNPEEKPLEDALKEYLSGISEIRREELFDAIAPLAANGEVFEQSEADSFSGFPDSAFSLLMNSIYAADRLMRNRMRKDILLGLAESGVDITIQGEGWEELSIYEKDNVKKIPLSPMDRSIEKIPDYRFVLDVNPCFFEGVHDRVSTALKNRCMVFSNMSKKTIPDAKGLIYYSYKDIPALAERVKEQQGKGIECDTVFSDDFSRGVMDWDLHADRLLSIIGEVNG